MANDSDGDDHFCSHDVLPRRASPFPDILLHVTGLTLIVFPLMLASPVLLLWHPKAQWRGTFFQMLTLLQAVFLQVCVDH